MHSQTSLPVNIADAKTLVKDEIASDTKHIQTDHHDQPSEVELSPTSVHFRSQPLTSDTPVPREAISESKDEKPAPEPTYYYMPLDNAEFADIRSALPEKFQKITKADAEKLLEANQGKFKIEYALDFAANSTNGLFPVWLVKTGSSGFILCASLLSGIPQETLQDNSALNKFSTAFVWINSLLAAMQWIFMYSPWTQAIKNVLQNTTKNAESLQDLKKKMTKEVKSLFTRIKETVTEEIKSLCDKIEKMLTEAWEHPGDSAVKLLSFLAFQFLTKLFNYSAASTELFFVPAGLTWIPAILILGFAARYCSQIWDESVLKGIDFWKSSGLAFWTSSKDHTSLVEQLKQGNYAIVFKTLFEGLSAMLLKGLQYFFIAEGDQALLGAWAPPTLMLTLGLIHGLLVNYPTAFKNAMSPLEALERVLNEKLGSKIDTFIETQTRIFAGLNEAEKAKHLKELVQSIKTDLMTIDVNAPEYKKLQTQDELDRKLEKLIQPLTQLTAENKAGKLELKKSIMQFNSDFIEAKVLSEGRLKLLTKDPLNLFTVILNTLFGGYAGYRLLSPALSTRLPAAASIPLMTAAGAATVGSIYYRAVIGTESKKAAVEVISPETSKKTTPIDSAKLKLGTFALATSGALASGLSAIGSAGSTVKNSTAGVVAVVFAASQKMINDARYSEPYLRTTLKTQASNIAAHFKSKPKPDDKPDASSSAGKQATKDSKTANTSSLLASLSAAGSKATATVASLIPTAKSARTTAELKVSATPETSAVLDLKAHNTPATTNESKKPVTVDKVRLWKDPSTAFAFAGTRAKALANSVNFDTIRFWQSDKKTDATPKVPQAQAESAYLKRNNFEF